MTGSAIRKKNKKHNDSLSLSWLFFTTELHHVSAFRQAELVCAQVT
jgi:hypothetical protein